MRNDRRDKQASPGRPRAARPAGVVAMALGTREHPYATITLTQPVTLVAGSIPILFSGWAIRGPAGYGIFGSLARHGVAEFLVVLRHR